MWQTAPSIPAPGASSAFQVSDKPVEMGLSSSIKELMSEVYESRRIADNLRSALGISQPPQNSAQAQEPSSLRDAICMARRIAQSANTDLVDCVNHINS